MPNAGVVLLNSLKPAASHRMLLAVLFDASGSYEDHGMPISHNLCSHESCKPIERVPNSTTDTPGESAADTCRDAPRTHSGEQITLRG